MNNQQAIEWQKAFKQTYSNMPCGSESNNAHEACDLAVAALKKQIPEKFVLIKQSLECCPHCHKEFNSELINEYDMRYCLYCGQAVVRNK